MPNTVVGIEKDYVSTGLYGRPIYHQCDWIDSTPRPGYPYMRDERRCGANSTWLVSQIGELSGQHFSIHLCVNHAKPFIDAHKDLVDETPFKWEGEVNED